MRAKTSRPSLGLGHLAALPCSAAGRARAPERRPSDPIWRACRSGTCTGSAGRACARALLAACSTSSPACRTSRPASWRPPCRLRSCQARRPLQVHVRSLSLCCFVSGALCRRTLSYTRCNCARGWGASSAVPVRCSPRLLLPTALRRPEEPHKAGAVPGVRHRAHMDGQPAQVRAYRPRRRHQRGVPSRSSQHAPGTRQRQPPAVSFPGMSA